MMLQRLTLLTLFVHSSLALALYDDINDHRRWRRGGPSIPTTGVPKIDDSKVFPDGCGCKGYILPFSIYAKPGEQTVQVTLPEPEVICSNYVKKSVNPPSNSKFKLGRHAITYSYWYEGYKRDLKCFVNFTVADHCRWRRGGPSIPTTGAPKMDESKVFRDGCDCKGYISPFTVYAKPGEPKVQVTLPEPEVICKKYVNKSVSPPSDSKFKLGRHAITYSYWYESYKRDLKCSVNFTVAACECPSNQTLNATVKPGETEASVSWREPEPSCPTNSSPQNPKNTSERFSVGKHTVTYKYTHDGHERGSQKFDVKCHVNIVVTGMFCDTKAYDPATHVCCCDKVHKKNSGHECCGEKYYNPSEKICCPGAILKPLEGHCPLSIKV